MKLIYRCLCAVLGAILGSGCSDSTEPVEYGPMPEYGVPTGTVRLDGRVVDTFGAPIRGIAVSFAGAGADTTDQDGRWAIEEQHAFVPCVLDAQQDCELVPEDIDGAANGGVYFGPPVTLDLQQTRPGDGAYDLGTWEQHGIDVVMTDAAEYGPPLARMPRRTPPDVRDR